MREIKWKKMCSNQKKESNIQNKKLKFIIIYCNICLAKTNNNQEEASADISPLNVAVPKYYISHEVNKSIAKWFNALSIWWSKNIGIWGRVWAIWLSVASREWRLGALQRLGLQRLGVAVVAPMCEKFA
jgi:hypothetical protein